jgi:hypothetical protein
MWLHHRDTIVSGKLRCPGKNADDAVAALPSGFRLKCIYPSRLAVVIGIHVGKLEGFRSGSCSSRGIVNWFMDSVP